MRAVVLQSNYLPWKGYFDLIQCADVFVYYDEVQYTKNDWRNRNRICSKNGVHWLTIPVSRDAVKLKISEVRLPDARWQQDHFKMLQQSYRCASGKGRTSPPRRPGMAVVTHSVGYRSYQLVTHSVGYRSYQQQANSFQNIVACRW